MQWRMAVNCVFMPAPAPPFSAVAASAFEVVLSPHKDERLLDERLKDFS
jgi:hypothetical protein